MAAESATVSSRRVVPAKAGIQGERHERALDPACAGVTIHSAIYARWNRSGPALSSALPGNGSLSICFQRLNEISRALASPQRQFIGPTRERKRTGNLLSGKID
jgi:hypothetical protein